MTLPGEQANLNITGVLEEKNFLEFVQTCFSQKRKTLRNNLLAIAADNKIHDALATAALRPDARAEQLTLPQFAALYSQLDR
jgi:16S rRNA (adenine1518-N6/adenine1519-N6)-dimethyltransferase